jgi:hypothetical protein
MLSKRIWLPWRFGRITHAIRADRPLRLDTAVLCDAERVRLLSESERITPMETYWRDFSQRAEDFDQLHARISRWKGIQQKYIDEIETLEKRSSSPFLKGMGSRIRDSVEGFRTLWRRGKG